MMVDQATASAPATRGAPPPSAAGADMAPGTTYLDQQTYLNAKANPEQLKAFIKDWINLGGRGIIGGDGKPASYWDVYQDLAHDGIDLSGLPAPESIAQGQTKGGGASNPLTQPAPAQPANAAPPAAPTSPELTDLLKTIGVDYQNAPAATPALLAFLRGLQGNMSDATATRNTATRLIGQRQTTGTEDINRLAERTQQNVTGDLVRRGVLQSGEATGRYARGDEDKASKLSNLAQTSAEGSAAADTAYTANVNSLRQTALEKVMETEMQQQQAAGQSAAQTAALQAQKDAADLAYQRQQAAQTAYQKWVEDQAKQGAPLPSGV
jgi:hypothetical protein